MPDVTQGAARPDTARIERSRLAPGYGAADLASVRPSRALLDAVVVQTWVQERHLGAFDGLVAFAMVTPPAGAAAGAFADIESEMRKFARALRLASARSRLPDSGPRILCQVHTLWLRFEESPLQMRLPAKDVWATLVLSGRPVCLVVGLDALPMGVGQGEIARYIAAQGAVDRVFMGLCRAASG